MKIYQSETINELATALAKAQAETQHAAKSADNPFFKSKYADLPAVIDAARPHLAKHGLSVVQLTDYDERGMHLITQINHSSGQWMRGWYPINPTKQDPQGLGSATTYARRYAYQAIVGISSSADDDDGNAASVGVPVKAVKSVFQNSAMRNTYQANTVQSFHACETNDELNTIGELIKERIKEMKESGNEYDALSVEEITKQYTLAKRALEQAEINKNSFNSDVRDGK